MISEKKDIGKDISLTPIEIVMRDENTDNINDNNFNIIVNLHPTDGTHWVLVIRRKDGPTYYFDNFGVETPLLFLDEYVDLGYNERIQQYDESYCGAYCLYMIYLIDRGFRNKSALNILVNQIKCPEINNECFCLGCYVNDNDNQGTCFADDLRSSFANNVNDKDNDKDNGLRSSFANIDIDNANDNVNDNDNDNDLRSSFANQGTCSADNVNDNDNDRDNFIYLFDEKHQRCKPNNKEYPRSGFTDLSNNISININEDLQSWLNDDNIITEATLPENSRCIISGPSECGKTFLLKKLILASIYFDQLYIIRPTGDQYKDTSLSSLLKI